MNGKRYMEVLALLRSKNRCLERFLGITRDYLATSSQDADCSGLTDLQNRRESTLKAVSLYDRKIEEAAIMLRDSDRTPTLIEGVKAELERKDALVAEILKIDLELISLIEQAKNSLLRSLSAEKKALDTLGKFKSTWMPPAGEGLDETL